MGSYELTRRRLLRQGAVAGAALTGLAPVARAARRRPAVAVFGGGVAGLTAAHELAERGFRVTVYERKALGGKARSIPVQDTGRGGRRDLPAEHGFRAEFSFYQNLDDTMRRIPFAGNANGVYDNVGGVGHARLARAGAPDLTAPMETGGYAGYTPVHIWESLFAGLREVTEIPPDQLAFFARQVAMYFTSCDERRYGQWEYVNWYDFLRAGEMSEEYRKQLAEGLTRNLAAAKPQDMSVNSTGIVGESFAYALGGRPDGPADRCLNAPTNESWIDPWVAHLRGLGVRMAVGHEVTALRLRGGRVAGATVRGRDGRSREIAADHYVSAVPVDRARRLFDRAVRRASPGLEGVDRVRTEWMNGVIFHLDREVPVCHGHVSYVDSQFALTSISQAQVWQRDLARDYGDGRARESFSTIISDWSAPGMVYGRPAWSLTRQQIVREVWEQLKAHLNDGAEPLLGDDMIVSAFVDPAITWPARRAGAERIATNDEPLMINTPGSWDDRPGAETEIPNLVLAGDYVRNTMNVATMESACETGRRAARAVLESAGRDGGAVEAFDRWEPPENQPARDRDAELYRARRPHVLDFPWPRPPAAALQDGPARLRELVPRERRSAAGL
jgi:uncharacterized protein with NAD-binding domain and iron-sulfur cluster